MRSALTACEGEATKIENLLVLRDKVQSASEHAEELSRQLSELRAEREEMLTELAVSRAREEDQRALLNAIVSSAQRTEHAQLLSPPPHEIQDAWESTVSMTQAAHPTVDVVLFVDGLGREKPLRRALAELEDAAAGRAVEFGDATEPVVRGVAVVHCGATSSVTRMVQDRARASGVVRR